MSGFSVEMKLAWRELSSTLEEVISHIVSTIEFRRLVRIQRFPADIEIHIFYARNKREFHEKFSSCDPRLEDLRHWIRRRITGSGEDWEEISRIQKRINLLPGPKINWGLSLTFAYAECLRVPIDLETALHQAEASHPTSI